MAATAKAGEEYICINIPAVNNHENENQNRVEQIETETLLGHQNSELETRGQPLLSYSMSQEESTSIEYSLTNKYIGRAVIINNLDDEQQSTRADVSILSDLLQQTGFQTDVYLNLTKPEMNDLRRDVILREETHENSSSFVLIVIAHGKEDNNCNDINDESRGVVRKVMDVNGRVAWDMNVVEQGLNQVSTLKGKPKLVIVEACRGIRKNKTNKTNKTKKRLEIEIVDKTSVSSGMQVEEESDDEYIQEKAKGGRRPQLMSYLSAESTHCSHHANMKDQLLCLATVRDFVAHTLTKYGSVYLQKLARPWKEFMYLKPFTEIHLQASNNIMKEPIEGEVYQVPEIRSTLALQLNLRNYLIQNEDPRKGHIYWKTKISILGRGYDQFNHQLKHYNVFAPFPNESGYKLPYKDLVEVNNESTEKSVMYIPEGKGDTVAITFHKEFRIAHIRFKENVKEKFNSKSENSNYFCPLCLDSLTFDCLESARNHMKEKHNNDMHPPSGANFHFSEHFKTSLKLSNKDKEPSNYLKPNHIQDFFDFWDKNFIVSHYMGGSVTATILVNGKRRLFKEINSENLKINLEDVFSGKGELDGKLHEHCKVVNVNFQGGIIADMKDSFDDISQVEILKWIGSIEDNSVPLTMEMTLVPIYLAVAQIDSLKGNQIKEIVNTESIHKNNEKCFMYFNNKINAKEGGGIISNSTRICGDKLIKYVGDTENNQRHGDGEGYFRNGDVYIGQWRNGKPEGLGTWFYKGRKEMKGIFEDEKLKTKLSGNPKKKYYQRKSFWLKTFTPIFILSIMIGFIGWSFQKTCTERIKEEWPRIYYLNGWTNTTPRNRAFIRFDMSNLSPEIHEYCKGRTVYIEDFPSEPNFNYSKESIPTDGSHIYAFQFPTNMTAEKLRPHGNKIFRLRSCWNGQDYNTCLEQSRDFTWYQNSSRTNLRNLTCPEIIVDNWKTVSEYNSQNATMKVDLTKLPDSCYTRGNPIYMQVISLNKTFEYKWEDDCQIITDRKNVMTFSEVLEFNQTTAIQEVEFFSGRFILRFKQGNNLCKDNSDVDSCESYDCTSLLAHHHLDKQENNIFNVWRDTDRNTNKIDPERKDNGDKLLKINPVTSGNCTLTMQRIPLYQVFLNVPYFTAQLAFNEMSKDETKCQEGNTREEVKVLSTDKSTYVNETQVYQINANSSYCLTLRPNYPFCRVKGQVPKCECFYQARIDCQGCNCTVLDSDFQHECYIITHSIDGLLEKFPGYK